MKTISHLYPKIALIIAILAAISIYPIYQAFRAKKPCIAVFAAPSNEQIRSTLEQINQSKTTLEQTLLAQLIEENSQLLARIPSAFPQINPVQWENGMKAIQRIKENDDLLTDNSEVPVTDDELSNLIYKTLVEYGINPARVELEFVSSPQSFLAACQGLSNKKVRHIIRANREAIAQKPHEVVVAYLRHEIQHLLTYDAIELMIVKDIFEKNQISPEEYYTTQEFVELKKFKEYRADLLAATYSIETAQAMMDDMQQRIKQFPHEQENPSHATHPTETQRKQALANLTRYMQSNSHVTA